MTCFLHSRRLRLTSRTGVFALSLLTVPGCRFHKAANVDPEVRAICRELRKIDPSRDPVVARTPVIDVHTHTFNARYLPLRGILLGKRDAAPPFSWLVTDRCAEVLADALADHTALAAVDGEPGIAPRTGAVARHGGRGGGPLCRVLLRLLDKAVAAGAQDSRLSLTTRRKRARGVAESMTASERIAVRTAMRMMGLNDPGRGGGSESAVAAAIEFLWTLTQSDGEMIRLFREAHRGAPGSGPPSMVIHMIDLAPVHDQVPDGRALLDFESQQIRRVAALRRAFPGDVEYFVAWNPYRDHWNGGKPGDSLRIVQEAVTLHGAAGVKVYPPSGYRPAGNEIPPRPRSLFSPHPGRQWDARYAAYGKDGGRALDAALEQLLEWCRSRDIPVFVHSGHGEFEARKGYGRRHSDPVFWRKYLEAHPEPDGSPCRLRLCFGHAGGADYWLGTGRLPEWGREVYGMCIRYPNVYCEVTADAALTRPDRKAQFAARLIELFAKSRNAGPGTYPFARKILYGTDWYLPDRSQPARVLQAAQTVFLHPDLHRHYADYFRRNALRFLKRGN